MKSGDDRPRRQLIAAKVPKIASPQKFPRRHRPISRTPPKDLKRVSFDLTPAIHCQSGKTTKVNHSIAIMAEPGKSNNDLQPTDPMGEIEDANIHHGQPAVAAAAGDIATAPTVEVDTEKNEKMRDSTKIQGAKEARLTIGEPLSSATTTATEYSISTVGEDVIPKQRPWYREKNPLKWGKIPPVPEEREVSREHTAGVLSRLTFQWMAPVMVAGYKRQLEENDIWKVNPERAAEPMTERLKVSLKKRTERGDKFPLLFALHETFFREFWIGGFAQFVRPPFLAIFCLSYPRTILMVLVGQSPHGLHAIYPQVSYSICHRCLCGPAKGCPCPAYWKRTGSHIWHHRNATIAEFVCQPVYLPRNDGWWAVQSSTHISCL